MEIIPVSLTRGPPPSSKRPVVDFLPRDFGLSVPKDFENFKKNSGKVLEPYPFT